MWAGGTDALFQAHSGSEGVSILAVPLAILIMPFLMVFAFVSNSRTWMLLGKRDWVLNSFIFSSATFCITFCETYGYPQTILSLLISVPKYK